MTVLALLSACGDDDVGSDGGQEDARTDVPADGGADALSDSAGLDDASPDGATSDGAISDGAISDGATDAAMDAGPEELSTDLPDWYEENRVQGLVGALPVSNLELPSDGEAGAPITYGTPQRRVLNTGFLNATTEVEELGLSVFTRFVKNTWEGPIWPSAVPEGDDDPNPVSSYPDNLSWIVGDAHSRNMHLGVYYWDGGEGRSSESDVADTDLTTSYLEGTYDWIMPSNWLCKDLMGNPIKATDPALGGGRTRGYLADFSSPFRGFTRTRIIEMGERGVDIFYFDERHNPNTDTIHVDGACFGASTEILYRATGASVPAARDWSDPDYRDYVTFQGNQLTAAFTDWKGALRSRGHEGLFVISGTYLSVFTLPYMDLGLGAVADSLKVEYLNGIRGFLAGSPFIGATPIARPPRDIGLSLGWVIPRDISNGRPPNLWFNGMQNAETVRAFVSATLAYGAVANLNINDGYVRGQREPLNPRATRYDDLMEGVRFGGTLAEVMAYARPYRYAAIHLSEHARNTVEDAAGSTWPQEVWREVMWPVTGAFAAFVRLGLPITIITDEQIVSGELEDYAVLYSPTPSSLPEVRARVAAFEAAGGMHVVHDESFALADPALSSTEIQRLTAQIERDVMPGAPVRADLEDLPLGQNPHAVFHRRGNSIIAAITNDFTFVTSTDRIDRNIDADLPAPPSVPGASVSIISACRPIAPVDALSGRALSSTLVDGQYVIRGLEDFQEIALISFQVEDCE